MRRQDLIANRTKRRIRLVAPLDEAHHVWPGNPLLSPREPTKHAEPGSHDHRIPEASRPAALSRDEPMPASAAAYPHIGPGLAENSWDFAAPDGVPGFGSLDPAEARYLLRLLGR